MALTRLQQVKNALRVCARDIDKTDEARRPEYFAFTALANTLTAEGAAKLVRLTRL